MGLELLGYMELPENLKSGGFDHAAAHCGLGRLYVAHTANDTLDVIDCVQDRYSHSIPSLTGVAGALVSDERGIAYCHPFAPATAGPTRRFPYLEILSEDESSLARRLPPV